ncbi:redoxin domain-containing protein [Sphingomonas sp. RHCKR7]|uniref:peroxiredoxin n=1 Tax=Sphingomonas folli TaxID=2862497 RepID=UPI001CA5BFCD|nr:redoxin domain-containing protein [Sphingomonas folli]MBW6528100.1 redoxin domain-containing protein [Sphingomonas folli]
MRRAVITAVTVALTAALAVPAAATLKPGATAPDFATRGAVAGKVVPISLHEQLRRGPVVLYFFPAAFTSGCNAEARAFAEKVDAFRAAGATVIGMSADNVEDLQRFSSSECAGKFAVASAGPKVVAGYDVALGRAVKGKSVTSRTSYVIGRDGKVVFVHDDMNPAEHVALTLAAVQKLKRG